MDIRFWPHEDLKSPCSPVLVDTDADYILQLRNMAETMRIYGGIGLAANQVGIMKQMLVARDPLAGTVEGFVNPRIVEYTGKWTRVREGCLSVPGFFETINRNTAVRVEYFSPRVGTVVTDDFTGQVAHVLQHEIEHLEGRMFLEHLKPGQRDALRAHLRKNGKRR